MASSYVNDLRLNEMATGDASGTWGTTTNTNLELIAEAFSYGTEAITTNADTHTTTIADGATDPGRALYLKYTGTLDSACTITIGPNTVSKVWIIENGTSGSQNIILSQGSGANITIPAGDTKVVYSDGAGAGAAFFDAFASLSVVDLKVQDDLTVTGVLTGASLDISGDIDIDGTANLDIVDIDGAVNMATTALVTGVLTTTATQVATGGITSGSDIISDTDSTDSLGSTGVRWLKGWFDTLTAGTLTVGSGSVTDSSGAISFGDENLTTTGIVTAAGTSVFTNLDISGDIDVDGTTNLDIVDIDGAVDMASTLQVDGAITSSAGATITLADNGIALNLISTDADANEGPGMVFYRNSSSPADNDALGQIYLQGENDADQKVTYSIIEAFIDDASDGTEDGILRFSSMVAGTSRNRMDITPTGTVFNEDSIDLDFRVESDNNANALFVQGSDGNVGIGTNSPANKLTVTADDTFAQDSSGQIVIRGSSNNSEKLSIGFDTTSNYGYIQAIETDVAARSIALNPFAGNVGIGTSSPSEKLEIAGAASASSTGIAIKNGSATRLRIFHNDLAGTSIITSHDVQAAQTLSILSGSNLLLSGGGGTEHARIVSGGNLLVGKTAVSNTTKGATIDPSGEIGVTLTNAGGGSQCIFLNREDADGDLILFRQANSTEGSISVSGATVSYNGFSGNHETSGISTDTEIGTVCSTIDELDTYTSGTKEGQTRADHAKIKVSDTVGDTRVYGVLTSYSETDNKPVVASVGIGSIKVTGACSGGDLLESNGDGTAKVQSDDIVRSKTIGKVTIGNSDTGVKLVSCVLYCG
jgi:hypothetical protein